jgi:hypothetical protein
VAALERGLEALRGELAASRQELNGARERIAALEKTMAELRAVLAVTQEDLRGLKQALGG